MPIRPAISQGSENGVADKGSLLSSAFERPGFVAPRRRPTSEVNFTEFSFVLRNRLVCAINAPCEMQVGRRDSLVGGDGYGV